MKRTLVRLLAALVSLGLVAAVCFSGYVYGKWRSAPELADLEPRDQGASSTIYDSEGRRLGTIESDTLRTPLRGEEIPKIVKQATVAIEDRRFYEHEGVDFVGVLRAAFENFRSGEVVEGGSTITQQVVKNLYADDDRTLERKIREAKLASALDRDRSKEQILTLYLNNVPYGTVEGQSAVGIAAAARTFFGKPAKELKLHEAALLAGLPGAPTSYDPFENPKAARKRRDEVIAALVETGDISPEKARAATARRLGVKKGSFYTTQNERYFFEYVEAQLIDRFGERRVRRGGLKVYTTIDVDLQRAARDAIATTLYSEDDPRSAVVSVDPDNGHIKAMVSSESFSREQFNYAAQSRRQPGSTFKPIVLAAALARGIDPKKTTYKSKRLKLDDPEYGEIDVETYDGRYGGDMSVERATLASDNTVYQQLALDLGIDTVIENAKRLGVTSELDERPAVALGGLRKGVSPLELARVYATLASGGSPVDPVAIERVEAADGEDEDLRDEGSEESAYDPGAIARVTDILQNNIKRGTGKRAAIGCPAAGKTGTTDDFKDAWFAGYTPALATSVWVGYPEPRPMRGVRGVDVSGSNFPADIWGDYMEMAIGADCREFPSPDSETELEPFCGEYTTTKKCGADPVGADDRRG